MRRGLALGSSCQGSYGLPSIPFLTHLLLPCQSWSVKVLPAPAPTTAHTFLLLLLSYLLCFSLFFRRRLPSQDHLLLRRIRSRKNPKRTGATRRTRTRRTRARRTRPGRTGARRSQGERGGREAVAGTGSQGGRGAGVERREGAGAAIGSAVGAGTEEGAGAGTERDRREE